LFGAEAFILKYTEEFTVYEDNLYDFDQLEV
jgi:hypothetical protein